MMENYSLSDLKAVTDGNGFGGGFGGDFFLVILFLFLFGGNGFGQNGFGTGATAAAQNEILLGQKFNGVENKLNEIGNGICNSTYALNNSVMGEGRALQTQIAQCCCDNRVGLANLEAKLDHQTGVIVNMFKDNEITNLRDKVQDLQIAASQCRQNEYLVNKLTPPCPVPAYLTCSPYQSYNPCCGGNYQPNI